MSINFSQILINYIRIPVNKIKYFYLFIATTYVGFSKSKISYLSINGALKIELVEAQEDILRRTEFPSLPPSYNLMSILKDYQMNQSYCKYVSKTFLIEGSYVHM